MARVGPVLLLLVLAACSATDGSASSGGGSSGTAEARDLRVEKLSAGAPGEGPRRPQVVLAASAVALSREVGAGVPDSGEGTYLAAYRGERPTGGYSVGVSGARVEGGRVTIRFSLEGPPSAAIVTEVLSYPYAIAVVRDLDPAGKEFSFVDGDGGRLDWPVRRVGG